MKTYGKTLGVEIVDLNIPSQAISKEFLERSIDSVDAFYQACDTVIQNGVEEIAIQVALNAGKPTFTCNKEGVYYGSLMGVVSDFQTLGEISGKQAADILRGKSVNDNIKYTNEYHLINTQTADLLGIEFPPHVIDNADEIVDWKI